MKKYSCKKLSLNHRMFETGRNLWRSSGPTPFIKQGHLELVSQDHVQMAVEYLQGGRFHHLSGQPVTVLSHLHSKKCFVMFRGNSCVSDCAPCLVTCHWAPLKRNHLCLLCTFPSGFYKIIAEPSLG